MNATVEGVILGAALAYIPRILRLSYKARALKDSLLAEVLKCTTIAKSFLEANVQAPLYRMPLHAWNKTFPEILAIGLLNQKDIDKLYDFYIEVDSFNRGLEQVNEVIGDGLAREREDNRNKLKAQNILTNSPAAVAAITSIRTKIIIA